MRFPKCLHRFGPALSGIMILSISISGAMTVRPGGAEPSVSHPIRIVLVGDSTVIDRSGWGLGFKQYLNDKAQCINLAHGGCSTLSYMREGLWKKALALKGNYYLILFGANNQPGKPGRSTSMATFVANMKQYVRDTRRIGAIPVLVTPMTRREWDKAHPGKIKSSLAPWAAAVRKIAAQQHVALIDLQSMSIRLCEKLGPKKCLEFSPVKYVDGKKRYDGTHLNTMGSMMFGRWVARALGKAVPELKQVLRSAPPRNDPVVHTIALNEIVSHDSTENDGRLYNAIRLAPDNSKKPYKILIEPGVYKGPFILPKGKNNIELIGENPATTIITFPYNVYEHVKHETYQFNPGFEVLGNNFHAENITFQNTSGDHGQALALRVDGDREVFINCRILGWQDTLMINNGRDYFSHCYIAGRVDFIYGSATAVFDHCVIHSRNGGHYTAASTPEDHPFGFVFLHCKLTGDPHPWMGPDGTPAHVSAHPMVDLGRPWRPYASVAYIDCWMGKQVAPYGWNNWGKISNEKTARYSEYHSTGPGANNKARVRWAHQLTDRQAKAYTVENILGGRGNGIRDSRRVVCSYTRSP